MEVRNCKGCGRLFNYNGGTPLCAGCIAKLEDKFQAVKEFLRDNPNASLKTVSEENDVSVKQIKQWVREERLSFTEESQITLECENCGAKILTGRFCEKCKTVLHNDLSGAIRKPSGTLTAKPKDNHGKDRMRYLDN
ncbi:MAG: class I tRNA ligase family protein [Lachnospiraceae bacterium]|nr:class I tRNA ligase family protein [Lachnospiraceae bacterium]